MYNIFLIHSPVEGHQGGFHDRGHGEQTCGCPMGRVGSGVFGELKVLGCKLLPLEWMSNEVLLWSTENYVSSLMTEPEHGRKICVYIYV